MICAYSRRKNKASKSNGKYVTDGIDPNILNTFQSVDCSIDSVHSQNPLALVEMEAGTSALNEDDSMSHLPSPAVSSYHGEDGINDVRLSLSAQHCSNPDCHCPHHTTSQVVLNSVILEAMDCLLHQDNCQIPRCQCHDMRRRLHDILPETVLPTPRIPGKPDVSDTICIFLQIPHIPQLLLPHFPHHCSHHRAARMLIRAVLLTLSRFLLLPAQHYLQEENTVLQVSLAQMPLSRITLKTSGKSITLPLLPVGTPQQSHQMKLEICITIYGQFVMVLLEIEPHPVACTIQNQFPVTWMMVKSASPAPDLATW